MQYLKKTGIITLTLLVVATSSAMAAMDHPGGHDTAMDHPGHGHEVQGMDHTDHEKGGMDPSNHKGVNIRSATVDGFRLAYHLIDMRERIKAMKTAGHHHEMKMTHHLMVYVNDPSGAPITSARVGYLVKAPDGSRQKLMCMAMGGGFGADLDLSMPGAYMVKSKIVVGASKIMDKFSYIPKKAS